MRQGGAGKGGVVVRPFIGLGRRGGGQLGGRAVAGSEVGFNPIDFESVKESKGIRQGVGLMMEGERRRLHFGVREVKWRQCAMVRSTVTQNKGGGGAR
jgi:hypothetical protein